MQQRRALVQKRRELRFPADAIFPMACGWGRGDSHSDIHRGAETSVRMTVPKFPAYLQFIVVRCDFT